MTNVQKGKTALISATRDGHLHIVELLLAYGANLEVETKVKQRKGERVSVDYICDGYGYLIYYSFA